MRVSQIRDEDLTVDIVDRLLYRGIEDTGERADCIVVLGSAKAAEYRVPAAVSAYKAGRASKLILCGGTLREFPGGKCSEAEYMYKAALQLGAAADDIILEMASHNTVENIQFARIELERTLLLNKVSKVLLVTAAYHLRRSLAIARCFFPEHITVIPCPANDKNTRRENWMNTPAGIARAKGEAMNIVRCVNSGVFPDFEI